MRTTTSMTGMRVLAFAGMAAAALSAPLGAHDPLSSKVTWTRDISRIFAARCGGCHVAGGSTPMPLSTYEDARPWTAAIRQQVLTRQMPIWHAARGYGDFSNDPSLSPVEIALVTAWVDAGAPRGDDRDVPPAGPGRTAAPAPKGPKPREVPLACGDTAVAGRLLAVTPQLENGSSASILAIRPNGAPEIVAWIRGYDPRYPTTYWLRRPLDLPKGSRLSTSAAGSCSMVVTLAATTARPRSRTAR